VSDVRQVPVDARPPGPVMTTVEAVR